MAVTTPTLGGVTLPVPSAPMTVRTFVRGGVQRMASGALVRDVISSTRKHEFTLHWNNITDAQLTMVHNALATVIDGTSRTFLAPTGTSYTVVLSDGGEPEWEAITVRGSDFRWSGSLRLEEV